MALYDISGKSLGPPPRRAATATPQARWLFVRALSEAPVADLLAALLATAA